MKNQRPTVGQQIRRKAAATLIPAVAGAVGGYFYAQYALDQELMVNSALPAMYASMGAIVGILVIRLAGLFKTMLSDFFIKD